MSLVLAGVVVFAGCGGDSGGSSPDASASGDAAPADAKADAKEITAFSFLAANNPGLAADVTATVSDAAIAATVPSGTNVAALVATFATTGASVAISGTAQVSGTTAVNFANPVTYRVTAADGSTRDYVTIVTVAPLVKKAITGFRFLSALNSVIAGDVSATINGTSITATVPSDTDVRALVATFSTTGDSVAVGGVSQISGMTANDFTNPVLYRVTAVDGSTQDYTVTVTVAPRSAKAITDYRFTAATNSGLSNDVIATIKGTSIAATVPAGTNIGALVATFSTTGTRVTVVGAVQVSGATPHNFAAAVIYHVVAGDGTSQDYTVTVTVAPASAKAITSYRFLSADNGGLAVNVSATISGTSIVATVPVGTTVTGLVATFSTTGTAVTVAGAPQVSGATANDFAGPVTYHVTALDGTSQDYTVTVTVATTSAKAIIDYRFLSTNNAGLTADVVATVTGSAITATVPANTNVGALVATFATSGTSVTVAGVAQVSGITANSFAGPVSYVVTAADDSTRTYTVTITVAAASAKAITDYRFLSTDNPSLGADAIGIITGTSIAVTVPSGTDITGLIATFSSTGTSVTSGGVAQISGATANSFTGPVTYRVIAADSSFLSYTVTVTAAPRTAKAIVDYRFLSVANTNAGLGADVRATISGTSIIATVPAGTTITGLVATFSTTGTGVTVAGAPQASGVTINNFASPVTYHVVAADGTSQDYTVTVTVAAASAKAIADFRFLSTNNAGLTADVVATITGTAIAATVPVNTNVSALVATFTASGTGVTVGSAAQVSGTSANSFAGPVSYVVTAADGSTRTYTVTITVAAASAKAITDYRFLSANNPSLGADAIGVITGTSIAVTVPSGTDVTGLIATFSITGTSIAIGGVAQVSGTTARNFTNQVTYRVTAGDGTGQNYPVAVTVAPRNAKAITSYALLAANNPGLTGDVRATITGTAITATLPADTDVSALVATFTTTGTAVTVGGAPQISGITANSFASPVVYRVTAADASTQDYTVRLTVPQSSPKEITSFRFLAETNPGLGSDVSATITGTAITATVPASANVGALVASFTTTGVSVFVGGVRQTSGMTPNSFTRAVTYRVMAANESFQDYVVTVTVTPGSTKVITDYRFLRALNPGLPADVIGNRDGTDIFVGVPAGTNVGALIATFTISGGVAFVGEVLQVSGTTPNNFAAVVTYHVVADDDTSPVDWHVRVGTASLTVR